MKKFDWVKALGLLCTVGGIVISVVNNIVEDKKMDAKVSGNPAYCDDEGQ